MISRRTIGAGVVALLLMGLSPALATPAHPEGGTGSVACKDSNGNQDGWVTYSPTNLWPPNHKLVTINISYNDGATSSNAVPNTTSDNDNSMKTAMVTNVTFTPPDGPGAGKPDGVDVGAAGPTGMGTDPSPANTSQQVAQERQGPSKSGRTYFITVSCNDMDGMNNFMGSATLPVTVPHDQGHNG